MNPSHLSYVTSVISTSLPVRFHSTHFLHVWQSALHSHLFNGVWLSPYFWPRPHKASGFLTTARMICLKSPRLNQYVRFLLGTPDDFTLSLKERDLPLLPPFHLYLPFSHPHPSLLPRDGVTSPGPTWSSRSLLFTCTSFV